MSKAQRYLLALGLATATVVAGAAPALADAPRMTVRVVGQTVTVTGTCPGGDTRASASYRAPDGTEPIESGQMGLVGGGVLALTFQQVPPGYYHAVMACAGTHNTAVVSFSVA